MWKGFRLGKKGYEKMWWESEMYGELMSGEGGRVSLGNSVDTNGSLEVSSRLGFKSTWEKED